MFLQEIATDVIVEVNGRRMRGKFGWLVPVCELVVSIEFRFSSQVYSRQSMSIFCSNFSRWLGKFFFFNLVKETRRV